MPKEPKGGHRGMFMLAPSQGAALQQITGVRDATYDPGRTGAEAGGMDDGHDFEVPTISKPSISLNRVWDSALNVLFQAMEAAEAGNPPQGAFYPIGQDDTACSVSGAMDPRPTSTQSLTDAIKNPVTVVPAAGDWVRAGNWT